jgi:hypothetical protein
MDQIEGYPFVLVTESEPRDLDRTTREEKRELIG